MFCKATLGEDAEGGFVFLGEGEGWWFDFFGYFRWGHMGARRNGRLPRSRFLSYTILLLSYDWIGQISRLPH